MKVIFLDIDGVLNSRRFFQTQEAESSSSSEEEDDMAREAKAFDPAKVKLLDDLASETGAEVVLSSAWRRIHELYEVQKYLEQAGFSHVLSDKTPVQRGPRGDEIQSWLDQHPDCDEYVVFDDDGDMDAIPEERFIQTRYQIGLQDEHIERALEVLNNSTD